MGEVHLLLNSFSDANARTNDGAQSSAVMARSPCWNRTRASFRAQNSRLMIFVISMLAYFASQQSVTAHETISRSSLLEISSISETAEDFSAANLISSRCTEQSYAKGSDYDYNVQAIFAKMIEGINLDTEVWEDASDFYDNLDTVYGVAGCGDLTLKDCRLCLSHIVAHSADFCPPQSFKMEIRLDKCFLRYDNYYINFPLKGYRIDQGQ